MTKPMPASPVWQKLEFSAPLVTDNEGESPIDRETGIIRQVTVFQAGPMKDGRGRLDHESIDSLVNLGNSTQHGAKSRLGHPGMSDDGVGKFTGRFKDFEAIQRGGKYSAVADYHASKAAAKSPSGDLPEYIFSLAEEDAEAFATSVIIKSDYFNEEGEQIDAQGMYDAKRDAPGTTLWVPTALRAVDIVDTGNATDSFLSEEDLPDHVVRQGFGLLHTQFEGQTRDVVEARCVSFLDRFLDHEFGEKAMADSTTVDPPVAVTPPGQPFAPAEVPAAVVPVEQPETDHASLRNEAVLAERNRAIAITELCQLARLSPVDAQQFIKDEKVTPDALRTALAGRLAAEQSLSGLNPGTSEPTSKVKTPEDGDRADYALNRSFYEQNGMSEEDFVATAAIERRNGQIEHSSVVRLSDLK